MKRTRAARAMASMRVACDEEGEGDSGKSDGGKGGGQAMATRAHHLPARIYGIFGGEKISFFWFRRNLRMLRKHNKKLGN